MKRNCSQSFTNDMGLISSKPKRHDQRMGLALIGLALLTLTSCMLGPDYVSPKEPTSTTYEHEHADLSSEYPRNSGPQFEMSTKLQPQWWSVFEDEDLNAMMQSAIQNNPSLQAQMANLRRSQFALQAGHGGFFPQVGMGIQSSHIQGAPLQSGSQAPATLFSVTTALSTVSFPLDIFGLQRRSVQSLSAQSKQQMYLGAVAYLTLTGNLALTAFSAAGYRYELAQLQQIELYQQRILQLHKVQHASGWLSFSTLLSAESQLNATSVLMESLAQSLSDAEHLLSSLSGVEVGLFNAPRLNILDVRVPDNLPLMLPSELIHNRPDIMAAEESMRAASANIGVATASMFPSISIGGTLGVVTPKFESLSPSMQKFWSIGPSINVPIFSGGQQFNQLQAAQESFLQAQGLYRQTVLDAFVQVSNAMNAIGHDAKIQEDKHHVMEMNETLWRLKVAGQRSGLVGEEEVLQARVDWFQARVQYISSLTQRLEHTAQLLVSLGGNSINGSELPLMKDQVTIP